MNDDPVRPSKELRLRSLLIDLLTTMTLLALSSLGLSCKQSTFTASEQREPPPIPPQPSQPAVGTDGSFGKDGTDGKGTRRPQEASDGKSSLIEEATTIISPRDPAALVDRYESLGSAVSPVDLVILMDTSLSMREEKAMLESNLQVLVSSLRRSGIDANITAIGAGFAFPNTQSSSFAVIGQAVGSHNAISILTAYMRGAYGRPLPLRPEAAMEAAIFSDDDGQGVGNMASDFLSFAAGRQIRVSAIVGQSNGRNTATCSIANVGMQHKMLAAQTGGSDLDLCASDWERLISDLAQNIVQRNATDFLKQLSRAPNPEKPVRVFVNNQELDQRLFIVDYERGLVAFANSLSFTTQDTLDIEYTPLKDP